MNLVVVESPAKAKTIQKILGKDFKVQASMGHIKDLLKTKLSIVLPEDGKNPDEFFEPHYSIIKSKREALKLIIESAKKAEKIYLATDPDREGEAIAWHIAEELEKINKEILRAEFIEITERGVLNGISNPRALNVNLYNSQKARRVLDRLVGYLVSPLLWEKIRRGLSAGRVQTVALKLVVDREKEIRNFVPEPYLVYTGEFEKDKYKFTAQLVRFEGKDCLRVKIEEKEKIESALKKGEKFKITKIEEKKTTSSPPPPFTTSKLQQEASKRFGFTPEKTMRIAQKLYEGVDITVEGKTLRKGLITYIRTDSVRVAPEALSEVRKYIQEKYGEENLPQKPNTFTSSRFAQEAHEAIRPTDTGLEPEKIKDSLKAEEYKLYTLIFNRFVASQMKPAEYKTKTVFIENSVARFKFSSKEKIFPGFTVIYEEETEEENRKAFPPLKENDEVVLLNLICEEKETQPPPRYTDSSLIKALEENGVGRPSTYAVIVKTLEERKYVTRNKRTLIPTELGIVVSDVLQEFFPDIFNVKFTADMEENLDEVEKGVKNWKSILEEFYPKLKEEIEKAKKNMEKIKGRGIETDVKCEKCGNPLRIMGGRFGEYLLCSNENCKNKKEFIRLKSGEIKILENENLFCEICGKKMVLKKGKFGKFYSCTGFPLCSNIKMINDRGEIISTVSQILEETCPECGNKLLLKKSRKGFRYIKCSNNKCKYLKRYSEGKKCPECGSELIERRGRGGKTFWGCSNYPRCKYVEKNSK